MEQCCGLREVQSDHFFTVVDPFVLLQRVRRDVSPEPMEMFSCLLHV